MKKKSGLDCSYRTSIKALIINNKRQLLLVKENGRGWDLPGGGLEWGEDPANALEREIKEELSCRSIVNIQPQLVVPWLNTTTNYHLLWILYFVEIIANDQSIEEQDRIKYFSLEEYIQILGAKEEADWRSSIDYLREIELLFSKYTSGL